MRSDLKNPDSNAPSVKLTMEEFYATAVDADYLIYNGTIDGQINSISELEAKNELFSEFKGGERRKCLVYWKELISGNRYSRRTD